MAQTSFLFLLVGLVFMTLILSSIALWISWGNRKSERLPHALVKKLSIIAIILEARASFSDAALLTMRRIQYLTAMGSDCSRQQAKDALRAFGSAIEQIEACEVMCAQVRAMNSDLMETYPGLALRAEELLSDANSDLRRERESLLDLQIG